MAASEVRQRGLTLLEVMVAVAISAVLAALAGNALSSARRVSRVSGEARLLVQRLQTARTRAVGQGNAQGYFIGPNGPGAAGPDMNRAYFYVKATPIISSPNPVSYLAGTDRPDYSPDAIPSTGNISLVTITPPPGTGVPGQLDVGFDIDGLPTVTPWAGPVPAQYCIKVADGQEASIVRWIILFNDGSVKVQGNETYCS